MLFLVAFGLAVVQPPAATCQTALGTFHDRTDEAALPGRVEGGGLTPDALIALRRRRGEAIIALVGGNFARADFRGARLHNICFIGTDLQGSDLRGADAPGSAFVGANLEGANLAGARLPHVLLRDANLKDVRAEGAVLAGGRFDGGWFEGSVENLRLDRGDLSGFRFDCGISLDDGCPVFTGGRQMSLREANLTGAYLFTGDYTGARIDRTVVALGHLEPLARADIAGPVLLRGGEALVELSPDQFRSLLPHLRPRRTEDAPPQQPDARPPEWLRPGARAMFVDGPLTFVDGFASHPLYWRLLPVLVGASSSRLAVRVSPDGTIQAAGEAIGANAHTCSLAAERLRPEGANGWYVGDQEAAEDDPPEWRNRPMPVLRFTGQMALINLGARISGGHREGDPRISAFVSCGARASFSDMVRVPSSVAEVDAMIDRLNVE